MTVEKKDLPNGVIPFQGIPDMRVRDVLMKINENIVALKRQSDALVAAMRELQRKGG